MKWKIFIFLELSSCVVLCGICFWWLLPFVLIFGTLNDLFSPIERMLLARMSELTCFLYCVNIVNMTQIATMVLWHAWHWSNMPTNIRDIQCLDKTDQNTIIPASRCNNSPFPHLTRTTVSLDPLLSVLKQFVGIFTIFLVWVFELSLDLSKWEEKETSRLPSVCFKHSSVSRLCGRLLQTEFECNHYLPLCLLS